MTPKRDLTTTAAVVPVFRPNSEVVANVSRIASQATTVIVVDDTGNGGAHLDGVLPHNVLLCKNKENLGQAGSLNKGIRLALDRGAGWIFTFDQDTQVPYGYVLRLSTHLDQIQQRVPSAFVVGPDWGTARGHNWEGGWCSLGLVQSGLLFDARVFTDLGMFREDFFIDGVDQEFLLRMHRNGLHTSVCRGLVLPHTVGRPTAVSLLGRHIHTTNHAPFRHYYVWRNHMTLIWEYRRQEPAFCRAELRWLVSWMIKALVFERNRLAKIEAGLHGLRDFLRGSYTNYHG